MAVLKEAEWPPEQIADLEALAMRVANSHHLQSSPKLREFFLYVVDCALRKTPGDATEQQIGVHVFHRKPGYNSGDDSIVRTQARLLRTKVNAYFADQGRFEPIVIEIPKGQYFPVFTAASDVAPASQPSSAGSAATPPDAHNGNGERSAADFTAGIEARLPARAAKRWLGYSILGAVALLLLGIYIGSLWKGRQDYPPTPLLDAFWAPFYATGNTLVVYNNPTFIGNPTDGLRILRPGSGSATSAGNESRQTLDETYTGTGEVEAIHMLTALFDAHGTRFELKRSKLVTWDEARLRSLLFIGRSEPEKRLNELHPLTQFYITETADHQSYIVNLHPHTGEPATFPLQSATEETAIVALLPGLQPGTRVALFSGLSTVGTQEAVQFLTEPESIRTLIDAVGEDGHLLRPFEAVLHIDTSAGVAMSASFIAIHRR